MKGLKIGFYSLVAFSVFLNVFAFDILSYPKADPVAMKVLGSTALLIGLAVGRFFYNVEKD